MSKSQMDDTETLTAEVESEEILEVPGGIARPRLSVSCSRGEITVALHARFTIGPAEFRPAEFRIRYDNEPPRTLVGSTAVQQLLFFPKGRGKEHFAMILKAERVLIEFSHPGRMAPRIVTFRPEGLDAHLGPLRKEHCKA